jgi:hypothetical protein
MNKFNAYLDEAMNQSLKDTLKEVEKFLKGKFPGNLIVRDTSDFKTEKEFDMGSYIIHIYEAETASGKDAIGYDIEYK